MHTFFINTLESIDVSRRYSPLFDSLCLRKKLGIINCTLDKIRTCAETILNIITRDDEIDDSYNIIVYVEIKGRNEVALATEKAITLLIEEELFSILNTYERKPNKAIVLYGEHFTRGAEYSINTEYETNMQKALWTMFPLPTETRAVEIIKKLSEKSTSISDKKQYLFSIYTALISEANKGSLLPSDSEFAASIIIEAIESASHTGSDYNKLGEKLFAAMENQRLNVRRQVTTEDIESAYVRLTTDSNIHAKNKSIYRILLFICRCAYTGDVHLVTSADQDNNNEQTIPDIDWIEFLKLLKNKKAVFKEEQTEIDLYKNDFSMFNEDLFNDLNKEFTTTEYPKLDVSTDAHSGLTIKQLKKAVEDTISEVSNKSKQNEEIVNNFITIITEKYNENKEKNLGNESIMDSTNQIEHRELTKKYITKQKDNAESNIAAYKRSSLTSEDIDMFINESKKRTEYFFDCLKKSRLIYIFGALFTLLIAVPYMIIQKGIFDAVYGWLFFIVTICAVVVIYSLSYCIFVLIFKHKIIRELRLLCDKFAQTQKNKQRCLESYTKLLKVDLPFSFSIKAYEMKFNEYLKSESLLHEYKTYHRKQLQECIRYIENTISELDLTLLCDLPEIHLDDNRSHIVLNKDKASNDIVYSFIDNTTDAVFLNAEDTGGMNNGHN